MDAKNAISHGCLFCKSGKEEDVVRRFFASFANGKAIAPTRTRIRRTQYAVTEERVPLLPGYVFFQLEEEAVPAAGTPDANLFALRGFSRTDSVLKLLKYTDGDWRLRGFDERFARMLFAAGGNIGISQAYFDVGKRIRIVDGFLKDYEGSIVRVNKKNKTVEVNIDLQGKKASMWLGYELVEPIGAPGEA